MLIEAIGLDIISTGWACVDNDWPHNRQSAQGTSNRHCARFDVAGRCLAVAATTSSGIKGHLEQRNCYGRWHTYSTNDLSSLSLSVSCPLLFSLPLLFSRIPVPEVIQNKPASQVHGEQDEALRQHAGRPLRARRSHAVRPRAKPSASHALDELPRSKPCRYIAASRSYT